MRRSLTVLALCLAGCAATPQQMAKSSNYDVCRFTMGGRNAAVAEQEARSRGLDCTPLYPAIAAQMQADNELRSAIMLNYLATRPAPQTYQAPRQITCNSYSWGATTQTTCN